MEWFLTLLLLGIGLFLIIKGGDWFVDATSWIAEVSGIPTFIIGATIVSLATTLPEILVSTMAAAEGSVDMAIGNAIGSVNANIGLIMAISLIFMPAAFKRRDYLAKSILLLLAISLLWGLSSKGSLHFAYSFLVLAVFVIFMIENVVSAKKHNDVKPTIADTIIVDEYHTVRDNPAYSVLPDGTVVGKRAKPDKRTVVKNVVLFLLGTGGIVGGAQLLVDNGQKLAEMLGVPDGIIGVTIIAVGTSLPELVTTITAIAKKKSELSVGNIIGANVIDIALILPLCSMISGGSLTVSAQTLTLDMPFCLAVAAFALIPALITGKFHRWQGLVMLCGYVVYIVLLALNTL